jgi:hypothetical protein
VDLAASPQRGAVPDVVAEKMRGVDVRLTEETVRAGLPVAWNGGDADYDTVDLFPGHPGRVIEESVDPYQCEVGVDLFVDWYRRRSESGTSWQYSDVDVIAESDYDDRVRRMDDGMAPLEASGSLGYEVHSGQPDSDAAASLLDRSAAIRELMAQILLDHPFPGQRELLVQLGYLRVIGGPVTSVDLAVDGGRPRLYRTVRSPSPFGWTIPTVAQLERSWFGQRPGTSPASNTRG